MNTALRHVLAVLLAVLLPAAACAQSGYPNPLSIMGDTAPSEDWYRACMAVAAAAPPAADLPDAAARKRFAACRAEDLYYDTLSQAQPGAGAWRKVRHCAIVQNDDVVLMMLYANGFGVRRDLDVAINRACRLHTAPAEMSGRVMHLMSLRKGEEEQAFDQCDDITSGSMGGTCAAIAARQQTRVRDRQLQRLAAGWTAAERSALATLRDAMESFADAHGENEVDLSGTLRGAFIVNARENVRDAFLADLRELEQQARPAAAGSDFATEDARLNQLYRTIHATVTDPKEPQRVGSGTIEKDGVRTAQRAWLRYRDAWVAFAARKYPQVPAAAIKARLTRQRNAQLAELITD